MYIFKVLIAKVNLVPFPAHNHSQKLNVRLSIHCIWICPLYKHLPPHHALRLLEIQDTHTYSFLCLYLCGFLFLPILFLLQVLRWGFSPSLHMKPTQPDISHICFISLLKSSLEQFIFILLILLFFLFLIKDKLGQGHLRLIGISWLLSIVLWTILFLNSFTSHDYLLCVNLSWIHEKTWQRWWTV